MQLNDRSIPIIGQTRTWKAVGMLPWGRIDPLSTMPNGMLVQEQFPLGLVMTGLTATRSDDLPIVIQLPIDVRTLQNPERLGSMFARAYQMLNSYLQCACVPAGACVLHANPMTRTAAPEPQVHPVTKEPIEPEQGFVEPGLRVVKH